MPFSARIVLVPEAFGVDYDVLGESENRLDVEAIETSLVEFHFGQGRLLADLVEFLEVGLVVDRLTVDKRLD